MPAENDDAIYKQPFSQSKYFESLYRTSFVYYQKSSHFYLTYWPLAPFSFDLIQKCRNSSFSAFLVMSQSLVWSTKYVFVFKFSSQQQCCRAYKIGQLCHQNQSSICLDSKVRDRTLIVFKLAPNLLNALNKPEHHQN